MSVKQTDEGYSVSLCGSSDTVNLSFDNLSKFSKTAKEGLPFTLKLESIVLKNKGMQLYDPETVLLLKLVARNEESKDIVWSNTYRVFMYNLKRSSSNDIECKLVPHVADPIYLHGDNDITKLYAGQRVGAGILKIEGNSHIALNLSDIELNLLFIYDPLSNSTASGSCVLL